MKTGMLTLCFTHTGGVKSDGRREIMAQSSQAVCVVTHSVNSHQPRLSHINRTTVYKKIKSPVGYVVQEVTKEVPRGKTKQRQISKCFLWESHESTPTYIYTKPVQLLTLFRQVFVNPSGPPGGQINHTWKTKIWVCLLLIDYCSVIKQEFNLLNKIWLNKFNIFYTVFLLNALDLCAQNICSFSVPV